MKRIVLSAIVCMMCLKTLGKEGYHVFTDTQGRAISARILQHDVRKQEILVKLENGRQGRIPLSQLSGDDQKYVKAWGLLKDFANEQRFKISAKRKEGNDDASSNRDHNSKRDVENSSYEVTLENKSDMMFENIELEYCIFYEQEILRGGRENCEQGIYYGKHTVNRILPKSTKVLRTESVKVYKEELNSDWYYGSGADNIQRGQVHGVWIRASISLEGGEKVVRDYCLPDSLANSRKWASQSVHVGMNR